MRALTSFSGVWRIPALVMLARYEDKTRTDGEDYWMNTPQGRFHCADLASAWQFWPGWEKAVKSEVQKLRGSLFLDVGANIGFYSVLAGRNGNKVLALEPDRRAFACLADNFKANQVEGEAINAAAWSETREVRLNEGRHTDVSSVAASGRPTRGVSIDELLAGRIPALIKIDVEGSEFNVLQGMRQTMLSKPKIIFEALSQKALRLSAGALARYGYRVERLDGTNWLAS